MVAFLWLSDCLVLCFQSITEFKKLDPKSKLFYYLASITEGYSGADIEGIAREATMLALRENQDAKEVNKEHFEKAIANTKPSLSKEEVNKYKKRLEATKSGKYIPTYMG